MILNSWLSRLSLPPLCWDHRGAPPYLDSTVLLKVKYSTAIHPLCQMFFWDETPLQRQGWQATREPPVQFPECGERKCALLQLLYKIFLFGNRESIGKVWGHALAHLSSQLMESRGRKISSWKPGQLAYATWLYPILQEKEGGLLLVYCLPWKRAICMWF